MHSYETLNDADAFPKGNPPHQVQVWYMMPKFFRLGISGAFPNQNHPEWTHILLGEVRAGLDDLDHLWTNLQGHNWSPNGEAVELIRKLGLQHTSMCVGDCFRLPDGTIWVCSTEGFKRHEETIKGTETPDTALLIEAASELRQFHSHHHAGCKGFCPTLDIIERIEAKVKSRQS